MNWEFLAEIGLKTVVTAGLALLLLQLLRGRSAAERSLVAHAGLAATLLLPVVALTTPPLTVEAPAAIAWTEPLKLSELAPPVARPASAAAAALPIPPQPDSPAENLLPLALYAVPALALALLTFVAVVRLFAIRRRATVLVDQRWLRALAHAQRRMGFKNGAALLVSDEIASPVSWGLFRPTIVLQSGAAGSHADAEAIIAHELAHVVRWDWLKLLAARAACALFWFNPLVWLLARHCHQLREEAADDAVLASEVKRVDYAQLLVGAARHEGRGLLLAANGVAPARDSLKRRVTRVLDASLSRRSPGRRWQAGSALAAIAIATPLAALTPVASVVAAADTPEGSEIARFGGDAPNRRIGPAGNEVDARAEIALEQPIEQSVAARVEEMAEAVSAAEAAVKADLVQQFELAPFSQVSVQAGGQVVLRPGAAFRARSRGSWIDPNRFQVVGGRLTVLHCTIDCSAGPVEVFLPVIGAVAVEGGGSILAGSGFPRAANVAITVRAGGTADLREVPMDGAVAAVEAGGTIMVRPERSLTAAVNSGGEIVYWGDPAVTRAISSGGTIRRGGGT